MVLVKADFFKQDLSWETDELDYIEIQNPYLSEDTLKTARLHGQRREKFTTQASNTGLGAEYVKNFK